MASNLTVRVLSALVIAPLAIGLTLWSYYSFAAFIALASLVMLHEWNSITQKNNDSLPLMLVSMSFVFIALSLHETLLATSILVAALVIRLASHALNNKISLWPALGIGYIGLAGICLLLIHSDFGGCFALWLLVAVWATDIGGYAFGKTIGGAKLAPSISPGKTWAGLFGGMAMAAAVGIAAAIYNGDSCLGWAVAGMLVAIISQIGDLMESKLKRVFQVKDSGSIIPGHGGVLDRLDGVLLAAPFCFFVAKIVEFKGWWL